MIDWPEREWRYQCVIHENLFIWIIEVLIKKFGHGEHVDAIGLEDCPHLVVAYDVALVRRILQIVATNVLPDLLSSLGSR